MVEFLFGLNVTVPGNNTIIDDEQDFEIALQSTVQNDSSLTHNSKLRYSAFVETDFGIKTSTRVAYLTVSINRCTGIIVTPILYSCYTSNCLHRL